MKKFFVLFTFIIFAACIDDGQSELRHAAMITEEISDAPIQDEEQDEYEQSLQDEEQDEYEPKWQDEIEQTVPDDFVLFNPEWEDWIFPGVGVHSPKDMGGRTLTFGAWWDSPIGDYLWDEEPPDRDSLDYYMAMAMWANARRVEEQFNVRFARETVQHEEFLTTLTASVIARSPFADVVVLSGEMQIDAIGNILQPWNANLQNTDLLGQQKYSMPVNTDSEGNIWAIHQNYVNTDTYFLAVNLDIIEAMDLQNPVELYEAGNWNWDTMLEIMRSATLDTDGDGLLDQFGIAGQPSDIIMHLIGANDGVLVDADFNYGLGHPNSVAALEFAEQIFHERLWAAEAGGIMDAMNWERNFYSGIRDANAALFSTTVWGVDNVIPAFNFAVVPFPKGPNNTSGNTWLSWVSQGYCIPVGTSWDVEDIVIILDELFSWVGDHPELLFETGYIDWFREVLLTEADVQRAVHAGISANYDMGRNVSQYYWVLSNFASYFWNREYDVMQSIERERAVRQDMLDNRRIFRQ